MDERYRQIYEGIYAAWVGESARFGETARFTRAEYFNRVSQFGADLGPTVEQAIARSEQQRRRRDGAGLREDAKALLAVNFRDLVVVPLVAGGRVSTDQIRADVGEDVAMLVKEAEPDRSDPNALEITGHAIIESLSRNWGKLKIGRYNLWENTGRAYWELS
jgi:ribosomal protein L14